LNPDRLWLDVSKVIGFFTKESASRIPEDPGCYAWFLPLWRIGTDISAFIDFVDRFLLYDAGVKGNRSGSCSIHFTWETYNLEASASSCPRATISDARQQRWAEMINNPKDRNVFDSALMRASILLPPLYVGKANNLKIRYADHVFGRGSEDDNFFSRFSAFSSENQIGLEVSDLLFVAIPFPRAEEETLEKSRLNELLEYIINRLSRPPFGIR